MKKIIVPTDYSSSANNALHYAIEVAKTINAEIHIFHGLEVPELSPIPGFMIWSAEDFDELKEEANKDLKNYIEKIKNDPELNNSALPIITYSSEIGTVKEILKKLIKEQKIDLVVMGLSGASTLDRFILGSNSQAVIEKTDIPILLIPKKAKYTHINKIAFATDFDEEGLNSIQAIALLFCLYDPEILLSHVNNKPSDFHDPRTPANQFLNRVTCSINYPKIYYRHIKEDNVNTGLKWLTENGEIDMLAMIHKHSNIFSRILEASHTKKMVNSTHLPLLVMPTYNTPIKW